MRTLHVGLRVSDLDKSLAFYTAVGYTVLGAVEETPFGSLTMLRLRDDPFVSIELVHDPARSPIELGTGLNHLVIQVESMAAAIAEFAANGVEADPPALHDDDGEMQTSWITDPDGRRIELVQWPAGHPAGMTDEDFATP